MQLRERAPVLVELVVVVAASAALAVAVLASPSPPPEIDGRSICIQPRPPLPVVHDDVEARGIPAADRLYRMRRFDEAANVAVAAGQLDGSVAPLAELYAQAARAWAALPWAEMRIPEHVVVTPLFERLRELRKLDTVLGAPFEAELDVKLAALAAQAAAEYLSRGEYADAATALATADALGITGPAIDRLHAELDRHRSSL